MAALTLEQKLEVGASDLRFLLTHHGIQDAHQGALFEAGVDTMAKFAAFVTTATDLVEPRYLLGQPRRPGGQLHSGVAERAG